MTTPTIDLPGLGRIDYTSPGSIAVALATILEVVNSLFHTDLGLSKYTATAGLVLAAAGAVGWVAEAVVKAHPRNATQVLATGQHLVPEIKQAIAEAVAAERAVAARIPHKTPKAPAVAKATPPTS